MLSHFLFGLFSNTSLFEQLKRAPLHASKYFSFESYSNAEDKKQYQTF